MFIRNTEKSSSILIVNNSEYVKYFEAQSSGTRPTDYLTEYIVYDKTDTVISVLSIKEPYMGQGGTGDGSSPHLTRHN